MSYKPNDAYAKVFTTSSPTTGAATNADSLPVATAYWTGSGTGAMSLTVSNLATGVYVATGTIPNTRNKGDVLSVYVVATVGGVQGAGAIDSRVLDGKRVADLNDLSGAALANLDAAVSSRMASGAAVSLAAAGLDAVVVETGVNARQSLSAILAAACGVISGAPAGPIVIKGGNVSATRINATVDASGNRTAVTLTLPS